MQELRCKKCGLALEQRGDKYVCLGCGAEYQAEDARRVADEMARLLDEQKQERVANLRQQLWKEFNEEFYDRAEISRLAKGIMAYLPDDFFAQFCDLATGRDTRRLNAFLYAADVKVQSMYIWDMLAFLLRPLREETLLAVNDLLARAGAAGLDMEGFRRCNEQLAREAEKLNAGVYDVTLPRDVFLAYSSADMAQVGELVEALEAQKISCFVAARNLQHGAIQNYEEQLRRAMDHCRTVVFVSSKNSRSRTCDALSMELPYIRERDIAAAPQYRNDYAGMPARYKKPRIEYLVDAHTHTAADAIVEEFFEGCEYCYDAATAAQRILGLLTSKPATAVKYCRSCGTENPVRAKLCLECGGREFVATREEYEQAQRKEEEEERREAEAIRRAEEEKKKAEEARKRAEEEAAALRAELEKLKKQAQAAAAKPAEQPAPAPVPAPKPKPAPVKKSAPAASQLSDFEIEDGKLIQYKGKNDGEDVVIPNSVTSIGERAFFECTRLKSITVPTSVKSIEYEAFNACGKAKIYCHRQRPKRWPEGWDKSLQGRIVWDVTEPTSIPAPKPTAESAKLVPAVRPDEDFVIENGVLKNYQGKGANVVIPDSVTSIGWRAFNVCEEIKNITIPNSVRDIEGYAFNGCTGLTSITIPNSVRNIESYAFKGCTGLTSITIPNSVTSIEHRAFYGCTGLTSITIPDTQWWSVFSECTSLTSVTIMEGATEIAEGAFRDSTTLTSITIPNSVTSIGEWAFSGCTGLTSITIPNSVTSIGEYAFYGCTGLKDITIPDSVTSIGDWAFDGCTGLKDITIPNSVTEIGSGAFDGCTGLTSISIPSSVTSIGNNAFDGCTGLKDITIPNSVTEIGSGAFGGCTGLTSIVVDPDNPVCHSDENCLIQTEEKVLVAGCKTSVIPTDGSVTSIGRQAFYGCTGLKDITIPDSVTSIGEYAFYGCTGLTSITIPSSVTSIGSGAFGGCTGLTSIVVDPDNPVCHSDGNCLIQTEEEVLVAGCKTSAIPADGSVTSIGDCAFDGCTGLTSITIPNSVTEIGWYAFSHCTGLTSITIPNSVTEIGWYAFSGCTGLISITIPDSVTSIGDWAFSDCTGLTSITIPSSVMSIGDWAFSDCTGLTSITIPNSVKSIGELAFACCRNAQIYCHAKEPEEWPAGWDESLKDRIIWDD